MFKLLTTFTGLKLSNVNIHQTENDDEQDEENIEETEHQVCRGHEFCIVVLYLLS